MKLISNLQRLGFIRKLTFIFAAIVFLIALSFVCDDVTQAYSLEETEAITYRVTYVLNGSTLYYEVIESGETASEPYAENIPDGKFIAWYVDGEEYDFSLPVTDDIILDALYTRTFSVAFIAEGEIISTVSYGYDDRAGISAPTVPQKTGYTGEWESYGLSGGNIVVNAVYTPICYGIDFYVEGECVHSFICPADNMNALIPPVPEKYGYDGEWQFELTGENSVTATAVYEVRFYTIKFYVDDNVLYSATCTAFNKDEFDFEIPPKPHYSASWSSARLSGGEFRTYAEYVPVIYFAEFYADGSLAGEVQFTVLDESLEEPPVPAKAHYSGEWEEYSLIYENFTVNAVYTPVIYTITFTADGYTVAKLNYTVETSLTELLIPDVPAKSGYNGSWEKFILCGGDIEVAAIYSPADNNIVYEQSGGGYAVTGYTGSADAIVIPSFYNGLPVTAIADSSFNDCTFEEITICENVQAIGADAFLNCKNLKFVQLPQSVTSLGEFAFMGCRSLEEVTLPSGLKSIAEGTFKSCGIESISLPDGLEIIGSSAFYLCMNLKEITIPSTVRQVGEYAFCSCTSLESMTFGSQLESIGSYAFFMCSALKSVSLPAPASWYAEPTSAAATALISGSLSEAAEALVKYSQYTYRCEPVWRLKYE